MLSGCLKLSECVYYKAKRYLVLLYINIQVIFYDNRKGEKEEMKIKLEAEIKSGVSKKTGAPYEYLSLIFPNGYEKRVFLEFAEKYMVENLVLQAQAKA